MSAELRAALERAQSVALVCHVSPDLDTLGSACALRLVLEKRGKRACVYAQDEVPEDYCFLKALEGVRKPDGEEYDLCVAVDVSDPERMGLARALFDAAAAAAVIDHHRTTGEFAPTALVRPDAAATAQIVTELCLGWGWEIPPEAAMCLWAGMSTDTGNFSFDSVTGDTLRAAGACVDLGAQPSVITTRLYHVSSKGHIRMLGRALNGLQLRSDDRVALMLLSRQDFADCGAKREDAEGVINYALEIESVCAAALLTEREGFIKCSLRGRAPFDVAEVAVRFGGGGHLRAAGCSLYGCTLEQAGEEIVRALEDAIK